MAKRLRHLRFAAGALLLGAVGCAFPNGSTGGDPLLGNFNRPIVPTPPPERSALGPDSPAYDGGARIGVGATDPSPRGEAPAGSTVPSPPGISPSPGSPTAPVGARLPVGGPDDSTAYRPSTSGARLPTPTESEARLPAPPPLSSRSLPEPGELPAPPIRTAGHVESEPSRVQTIEEVQFLLQQAGVRDMRVEQAADGEWVFDCTLRGEAYQGRGRNALEAQQLVLEQVRKER